MQPGGSQAASTALPTSPAERIARLQALPIEDAGLELLTTLTQQLPSAADLQALFADIGDAPAPPAATAEAAECAAALALHLRRLTQLVQYLGAVKLGLDALVGASSTDGSSGGMPPGPPGSVHIEEMDSDAPSTALPVSLVLAAALYGADAALQRPWATAEAASAAQELLAALAAQLPVAAEQQQRRGSGSGALLHEVATTRSGRGSGADSAFHQQLPAVQQLVALALPGALQQLRPVVAAKVEHGRNQRTRLEPYTGPSNFERCAATGQLAWLLRQLHGRHLNAAVPAALQLVLAAAEDTFPPAQACALWALQHLAAAGQATDLSPHAQLLLGAAKRSLAGCADAAWPAAAAAAIAVVARLEGPNPYSQPYHDVISVLLDEGELGAHRPERAATWLAAAPPLFPHLGLQLASHFARLMPLLLGWCLSPRQAVRLAALQALLLAVRQTWPRVGVHAPTLWRVLLRVHEDELRYRASLPAAGSAEGARAVAAAAEDAALALWCAGGADFQLQLMTSRGAGEDDLLQAIMQRLEESTEAAADQAEGDAAAARNRTAEAAAELVQAG